MNLVRRALRSAAELAFAAGARAVIPSIYGLPEKLGPDQLDLFLEAPLDPRAYSLMTSHLFGTARMGGASDRSVVDKGFETYGLKSLYVVDSSVFPNNLGVNPQHTIMAVAHIAARRIAGQLLS
jgi:choline dehydrogenase-like flavoprotein